jgi:hypothetical protein
MIILSNPILVDRVDDEHAKEQSMHVHAEFVSQLVVPLE